MQQHEDYNDYDYSDYDYMTVKRQIERERRRIAAMLELREEIENLKNAFRRFSTPNQRRRN